MNWIGKTYNEQIKPTVTTVYNDITGLAKTSVGGIVSLEKGGGSFLSNGFTPIALGAVALGALLLMKR